MPDITDVSAVAFSRRARETATALELAYWMAKRLSREWYAQLLSNKIPVSADLIIDSRVSGKALTGNDVVALVSLCDGVVAEYEATSSAKLNVVVKASDNLAIRRE